MYCLDTTVTLENTPPSMSIPLPPVVGNLPSPVTGAGIQTSTQDPQHPKTTAATHDEMEQSSKKAKNTCAAVSKSINNLNQKLSETMAELKQKIFGQDDTFTSDWASQKLEAWVTQNNPLDNPMKIPFGHQRLQYGLTNISHKKFADNKFTTFDRYMNSTARVQIMVDEMTREANRMQKRERVCLAFQIYYRQDRTSFVVAFFSIRDEKPPISFTDCIGRKMSLPYEICKTWIVSFSKFSVLEKLPE